MFTTSPYRGHQNINLALSKLCRAKFKMLGPLSKFRCIYGSADGVYGVRYVVIIFIVELRIPMMKDQPSFMRTWRHHPLPAALYLKQMLASHIPKI